MVGKNSKFSCYSSLTLNGEWELLAKVHDREYFEAWFHLIRTRYFIKHLCATFFFILFFFSAPPCGKFWTCHWIITLSNQSTHLNFSTINDQRLRKRFDKRRSTWQKWCVYKKFNIHHWLYLLILCISTLSCDYTY